MLWEDSLSLFKSIYKDDEKFNRLMVLFNFLSGVSNVVILMLLVIHYKRDDRGPQWVLAYLWVMNVCSFSFMAMYLYFLPNRMPGNVMFKKILRDGMKVIVKSIFGFES